LYIFNEIACGTYVAHAHEFKKPGDNRIS